MNVKIVTIAHTEDDTFNALKRVPLSVLVPAWRAEVSNGRYKPWADVLENAGYTVDEYLKWHMANISDRI